MDSTLTFGFFGFLHSALTNCIAKSYTRLYHDGREHGLKLVSFYSKAEAKL